MTSGETNASGESRPGHARPYVTFDVIYRYLMLPPDNPGDLSKPGQFDKAAQAITQQGR